MQKIVDTVSGPVVMSVPDPSEVERMRVLEEALKPRVGSPMVLASQSESVSVSIGVDDDLDGVELGQGCVLGDTECESCQ